MGELDRTIRLRQKVGEFIALLIKSGILSDLNRLTRLTQHIEETERKRAVEENKSYEINLLKEE